MVAVAEFDSVQQLTGQVADELVGHLAVGGLSEHVLQVGSDDQLEYHVNFGVPLGIDQINKPNNVAAGSQAFGKCAQAFNLSIDHSGSALLQQSLLVQYFHGIASHILGTNSATNFTKRSMAKHVAKDVADAGCGVLDLLELLGLRDDGRLLCSIRMLAHFGWGMGL
jgi:hypothetical protein